MSDWIYSAASFFAIGVAPLVLCLLTLLVLSVFVAGALSRWLAVLAVLLFPSIAMSSDKIVRPTDEPAVKVLMCTASWCPPCKVAHDHTLPALKKLGYAVAEADGDKVDVRLWDVTDLPTFVIHCRDKEIGRVVGQQPIVAGKDNATLKEIEAIVQRALAKDRTAPHALASVATSVATKHETQRIAAKPSPTFDLVGELRRLLGVATLPEHSSFVWQFSAAAAIELDGVTITRPKRLEAEIDFKPDGSCEITFGGEIPKATKFRYEVDLTHITIKGNVVSAGANLGFGFEKNFEIEIKQNPFRQ